MHVAKFCWYELMTTAPEAAAAFYADVVGWRTEVSGTGGPMPYTLLHAGAVPVGGLMGFPPELAGSGKPPMWSGYLAVDDVDAMAARVLEAGGRQLRPAADIPGVGRFAVMADPQGAAFVLFRGEGEAPPPAAPGTPGTVGWRELTTSDADAAFAFYTGLFGWTSAGAHDMGAEGTYQMFSIDGHPSGGMMNRPAGSPAAPGWTFYIDVADVHAAAERVRAGGGQVLNGPMQVPGGSWIINARDPQGAVFSLVSPAAAA